MLKSETTGKHNGTNGNVKTLFQNDIQKASMIKNEKIMHRNDTFQQ